MDTEDSFKNGSKQGALWEVENFIKLIEELSNDSNIYDLEKAYESIIHRLKLRQQELMNDLNWKEV